MGIIDVINFSWKSFTSSSLSESALQQYQLKLFKKSVSFASAHSLFYQNEFNQAGLKEHEVKTLSDVSRLPIIKKNKLIKQRPEEILTTPLAPRSKLRSEQSSGTSGTPFSVYFNQLEYFKRSITFLRALFMIGYRPGDKLLLLTQPHGKPTEKPWLKWYYASITESQKIVADYYFQVKPDILYGCTTSIKLLAETIQASSRQSSWHPKAVVTTAETLDAHTRKIIEDVFHTEVFDFYGMSEVGLVAWECKDHRGYHIAEDMFLPELIPVDTQDQNHSLIITSLHQRVMPFIRFDTGDYCIPVKEKCACGSSFNLIKCFNGRVIDSLLLANGQLVSPYKVTCALETISGLSRYQVIQQDFSNYKVLVERSTKQNSDVLTRRISEQLKSVLGKDIEIDVNFVEQIELNPGQKFRPVLSLVSTKKTHAC